MSPSVNVKFLENFANFLQSSKGFGILMGIANQLVSQFAMT